MKNRKTILVLAGISLGALALIVGLNKPQGRDPHNHPGSHETSTTLNSNSQTQVGTGFGNVENPVQSGSDSQAAGVSSIERSAKPDATKAAVREKSMTSRKRLSVIDPMASWSEQPPWPEGPRLFAEVETRGKKYINLRPNDVGLMPQINVAPSEALQITLQVPESTVGERIHIELPNGGKFSDQEATGRILTVGSNRSIYFQIEADETMGNCTVHIRQSGHTRTLPLWIGAPPVLASGDEES